MGLSIASFVYCRVLYQPHQLCGMHRNPNVHPSVCSSVYLSIGGDSLLVNICDCARISWVQDLFDAEIIHWSPVQLKICIFCRLSGIYIVTQLAWQHDLSYSRLLYWFSVLYISSSVKTVFPVPCTYRCLFKCFFCGNREVLSQRISAQL